MTKIFHVIMQKVYLKQIIWKFTYFNLEEFHHEINKLIQDSKYRNEKKVKL